MHRTFLVGLLGLAVVGLAVPASADNTRGQCNQTIAVALGAGHQVVVGVGDQEEQCLAVSAALLGFLGDGCLEFFDNGELRGLITASNAPQGDRVSPLGTTICTALIQCGLGPFLPPTVCPDF
jgi:hypothetical protein